MSPLISTWTPPEKDDKPSDRKIINLAAGGTGSVSFETRFAAGGEHKLLARLANGDRLAADDCRYCVLGVMEDAEILLVDGNERLADNPLACETGFLRYALSPRDFENPDKQGVVVTETIPYPRLYDANLRKYHAVVLANVARINPQTAAVLERQVRAGMGLLIFLGEQTDPSVYMQLLGENGVKLLPAHIGAPWGEAPTLQQEKLPPSYAFAVDRLVHPIMAEFKATESLQLLSKARVYRAFDLEPLKSDAVKVVAYLANGKPAIIEKTLGAGFVFLFAFPATTKWSNLPNQYAFPIIMLRTVNLIVMGNRRPRNLLVATPIRGAVAPADQNTPVVLTPPPPALRRETKPEALGDGRAGFEFDETSLAGFYEVELKRQPKVTMLYALNPDAENESELKAIAPEELKLRCPGFDFSYVSESAELEKRLSGTRQGTELYPWLLALVFLCLAAESILAVKWAPKA